MRSFLVKFCRISASELSFFSSGQEERKSVWRSGQALGTGSGTEYSKKRSLSYPGQCLSLSAKPASLLASVGGSRAGALRPMGALFKRSLKQVAVVEAFGQHEHESLVLQSHQGTASIHTPSTASLGDASGTCRDTVPSVPVSQGGRSC